MFERVFVANRGEIAVRVLRTLRRLGIQGIAPYSDADRAALHVQVADDAVRLGPTAPRESYLHIERIIDAALGSRADALHPGYGFLAESAALAQACADAGITFIGPTPDAIAVMGDKIRARDTVAAAGVPVVPGRSGVGLTNAEIAEAALDVGLPVLLKPSAGGGGKGMHLVTDRAHLAQAIATSRREAAAAFGDDTLLVERFVEGPRHIEVQVAADHSGGVVHLGERECSLQRRHQKIIEEAPSPFVTPELREAIGAQAVAVARACGYTNLGTVELIVSGADPTSFFFMEMNTRLQVEHPVTEEVYGLDLVELQLRIASGEPLPFSQDDVIPKGHAVEARVYAEDPEQDFLPTGGTVLALREPAGPGIRVDSGLAVGTEVGSSYDPMLSKVIAAAPTREAALDLLDAALAQTSVLGVTTNLPFLRTLLRHPDVRSGNLDTGLVERVTPGAVEPPDAVVVAALLALLDPPASGPLWGRRDGWRLGEPAWVRACLDVAGQPTDVALRRRTDGWTAVVGEGTEWDLHAQVGAAMVTLQTAERRTTFDRSPTVDGEVWLGAGGRTWLVAPRSADRAGAHGGAAADGSIASPMPGTVASVNVVVGEHVADGQAVAVVEAMKMEHTLVAPFDGVVTEVHVAVGAQVALRQVLVTVAPEEQENAG
jgi:acetyl-CoA/propionyl-CoA carboxylase biotin carboxyl carrier protein